MKKAKKVNLYIDADQFLYESYHSMQAGTNDFGNDGELEIVGKKKKKAKKADMKPTVKRAVRRFEQLIKDVEDDVAVDLLGEYKIKHTIPVLTGDTNFRYTIFPEYKAGRPEKTELFYMIRDKLLKLYPAEENCESDDVCAYYARKGHIVASFDKDILRGVGGVFFDTYHTGRYIVRVSELEARNFRLIQTLTGDRDDNIAGIRGVGEKTAIKLFDEFGWNWQGVVRGYEKYGLTEKDAILTRRLIGLDQWTPNGIKLWNPLRPL